MNELFKPKIQSLIQRVQTIYPDFHVRSVRRLDSGQNNDVIVLNDEWIFRFPHHKLGAVNLKKEVTILRSLKGHLPFKIPYPEYVYIVHEDASRSFMGYQMIPGKPLTREWVKEIDESDLNIVATQLDDFLHALHTQSISRESHVSIFEYWSDIFERIQRLLFPHMRPEACKQVSYHFESFLKESRNFDVAMTHGDFGTKNILVDTYRNRVVAVIDFSSVGIGDPAVDYAAASTVHPRMLELMLKHNPSVHEYSQRIEFYKGTFALQEALYGAESGDKNAFRSGIDQFV